MKKLIFPIILILLLTSTTAKSVETETTSLTSSTVETETVENANFENKLFIYLDYFTVFTGIISGLLLANCYTRGRQSHGAA
ncbi:MAG: hypothetical protein KH333_11035 [Clostridium sp.]|nr:hypothetical protein [Clostridium sp.]